MTNIINPHRFGGGGSVGFGDELLVLRGPSGTTDLSGNGNDGTYDGGTSVVSDTGSGGVSAFVGDGIDNSIELGTWTPSTGDQSWGCWVKTSSATQQVLISKRNDNINGVHPLIILRIESTGEVFFGVQTSPSDRRFASGSSSGLNDGSWHLIVGTFNNSTQVATIYVDGASDGSNTSTAGTVALSSWSDEVSVMCQRDLSASKSALFNGRIDDIRISDTVWTPTQISSWFSGGRGYNA